MSDTITTSSVCVTTRVDRQNALPILVLFTSREAARSREGVVLPGEEEEDVCLKKGSFDSRFMVASLFGLLWLQ